MKKVYEYKSIFDLNKALSQFEKDGLEVCVKIISVGDKPDFFCVTDDEEGEKEEEPGDSGEEGGEKDEESGDSGEYGKKE